MLQDKISSREIKNSFLKFFESNDHLVISDSSIIPKNDPTLLFINSGMAPLKNFFSGEEIPPKKRLCNVQPCIRTIDIDDVGDRHHLTSFQMLGSWSIGDYFKEYAIKFAYTLLTEHLHIPREKIYVTIFSGDESIGLEPDLEAKKYWMQAGVDESHIVACGKEDNFWGPTSETGPCGPCTEVFYDTGEGDEGKYVPGGHFDTKKRYIEIWNAGVFMQLNKNTDGTFDKLKFKSVDTGAGLERLAMVLNGYDSVYDTDLLRPIRKRIEQELPTESSISEKDVLIMTDHLRTISLILSEKVAPANEGRGYIPRKLIRKCIMLIAKAKIDNFDFDDVVKFIIDMYQDIFPLFAKNKEYIIDTFNKEAEQFQKVIVAGLNRLQIIKNKKSEVSAVDAFELVTTYGLPFDIICDFARENNMKVDKNGFEERLANHKKISGQSKNGNLVHDMNLEEFEGFEVTDFKGYEMLEEKSTVVYKKQDKDKLTLITKSTCFYAQSGGQCADTGVIENDDFQMRVDDVVKTKRGTIVHFGHVIKGSVEIGDTVCMLVDKEKRQQTAIAHSCVHLLHSALKNIFGKNVNQAGSKVEPNRLRFDFNYDEKISRDDICKLESKVNDYIRMNLPREVECTDLETARKKGAMALFENKYANVVRMVSFGDVSRELCAGTHASRTGDIGFFTILSAEGIGKGIKRISALVGSEAIQHFHDQMSILDTLSSMLKVKPDELEHKIRTLQEKPLKKHVTEKISIDSANLVKSSNGMQYACIVRDEFDKTVRDELIRFADEMGGIVIFVTSSGNKHILIAASDTITDRFNSGKVLKELLSKIGGKGGGNARLATGGGVSSEVSDIIKEFEKIVENLK